MFLLHRIAFPFVRASVVLGLLVVGMGGCQPSADEAEVARTDEGTLRLGTVTAVDTLVRAVAPSDRPLVIQGVQGGVRLTGTDTETADLQFVVRARGTDAASARAALDAVSITESGTEQTYTYALERDLRRAPTYTAVDVEGTVPRSAPLRVDRASGPVTLTGVEGPLTVRHDHGPVTIRGAAASVDVRVRNGDLQVDLRAVPSGATVSLETANGDVLLTLPPDAAARLDVQTNAGEIRTQGLSLTAERYRPMDAGGRYNAEMGGGGASVEVSTNNGNVRLRAADEAPSDPAATDTSVAPETSVVPPADTTVTPRAVPDTAEADTATTDTATAAPPAPDTTEE